MRLLAKPQVLLWLWFVVGHHAERPSRISGVLSADDEAFGFQVRGWMHCEFV